jgi:serine/threonine protein kinase
MQGMQGSSANPLRRTMAYVAPSPQPGAGNDYKLGRRLDRGGPDEVFEAFHASQPGRLAIKLARRAMTAPPQAAEAFRRETALVARLRHPHAVQVVEIGRLAAGVPFVVMEFLPGQTLRAHLGRRGPVPAVEAVPWLKAMAGALSAAHASGAVHGGLRPSKVFLMEAAGYDRGFVKILDFGAWHLGMGSGRGPDGEVATYTAPELAHAMGVGRPEVLDPRTDQYSLAAIAYRLLAARDVAPGDPRPLSSICACDPLVEAAVMRGLARHPHQRWESVQAFATAFEQAALSALPVLTQTVSRNQVVAAASMERQADDPGPTPPPAAIRMTASAPAAMPASAPEDELTDELSQKFFAEGEAQQAAHTVPQAVYRGQQQPNHPSMRRAMAFEPTEAVSSARVPTGRRPAYRQADEDQDLQISLEKLERVPRRRWPGRLLLLIVLVGGAAAFWRSDLPYSAEVRDWVGQRVTLPDLLKR